MSQTPASQGNPRGRGGPSSRGSRGRGGRSRGKAARARGSSRGMRIPPEYLAQVIAQREGRDPALVGAEGAEEDGKDEDDEDWKKYAPRTLVRHDDEEEQEDTGITIVGEEDLEAAEEERQAELETQRVLALHREKASSQNEEAKAPSTRKQTVIDETDVDHALGASLRAMALRDRGKAGASEEETRSKVIQIEWDAELESLQRDKAEAEARTALKQRFKNPGVRGRGTGGPLGVRKPAITTDSAKPEMEVLEDFLDDLLR
ncbi:hypothetical protein M408DRAFT_22978 [Serendipita vermifera MAFF 305830]|uniref:Uncharacterized protein n=1 Tax=Serendipita vermifera MAFF 305830 TaxID=933852 RepID=A0A0C2XJD8_SERVB|nr:hypothetical protein M408DRAFT_22978 [Serendipita vermifera MAFF 305830]